MEKIEERTRQGQVEREGINDPLKRLDEKIDKLDNIDVTIETKINQKWKIRKKMKEENDVEN